MGNASGIQLKNAPAGAQKTCLSVSASITRAANEDDPNNEAWAAALLRKAKRLAPVPALFDRKTPFFWQAEISNDMRDSYHTRMNKKTLRNFASDVRKGVSFQYSHSYRQLGLGMSIGGKFEELDGGDEGGDKAANMRTIADFYTIPGVQFNSDMNTDSLIEGVQSGVLRDVSVGFYADRMLCSACGEEMHLFWGYNWGKCNHIPGVEYDDENGKGVAFAWVDGGRLSEVSQVYDGATPNAGIIKASMMAEAGALEPARIRILEQQLRHRLPGGYAGFAMPGQPWNVNPEGQSDAGRALERNLPQPESETKGMDAMANGHRDVDADDQDIDEIPEETVIGDDPEDVTEEADTDDDAATDDDADDDDDESDDDDDDDSDDADDDGDDAAETSDAGDEDDQRAMLVELNREYAPHNIRFSMDMRGNLTATADTIIRLRGTVRELRKKEKLADAYVDSLVADAVTQGNRAMGKSFNADRYTRIIRRMVESGELDDAKALIDDWKARGDERFLRKRQSDEGAGGDVNAPGGDNVLDFPAREEDKTQYYR